MPAVVMPQSASRSPRKKINFRQAADVFKALGHQSRLRIVDELSRGERSVAELTELIGHDMSTVSKHLSVLRSVGLISDEKRSNQVFYRLTAHCVTEVFFCLDEYGCCPTRR